MSCLRECLLACLKIEIEYQDHNLGTQESCSSSLTFEFVLPVEAKIFCAPLGLDRVRESFDGWRRICETAELVLRFEVETAQRCVETSQALAYLTNLHFNISRIFGLDSWTTQRQPLWTNHCSTRLYTIFNR
jgi:hypothetical protein